MKIAEIGMQILSMANSSIFGGTKGGIQCIRSPENNGAFGFQNLQSNDAYPGEIVTINGANFAGTTAALFNGIPASSRTPPQTTSPSASPPSSYRTPPPASAWSHLRTSMSGLK